MLRLYFSILMSLFGSFGIIGLIIASFYNTVEWWMIMSWMIGIFTFPYFIAQTIKSIKLLKVEDRNSDTK